MSRTLFFSFLMLLSYGPVIAEGHHEKRDTHVTIVTEDKNHDHCHEKIGISGRVNQLTRNWIRPTIATAGLLIAYANAESTPEKSFQKMIIYTSVGFSVGHFLKQATKLSMYLRGIPKN